MELDFQKLQQQLIRALRGSRSQVQLSNDLGYSHNQLYRWESGRVGVSWSDFVRVCRSTKHPLEGVAREFLGVDTDVASSANVTRALIGMNRVDDISAQAKISRYSLYRWMNDKAEPDVSDVLALMYVCCNFLFEFVGELVDPAKIPLLKDECEKRNIERQLHYEYPLFGALVRCLELTDYERQPKHCDRFVAKKLGVHAEEVKDLVDSALRCGALRPTGNHYQPVNKSLSTKGNTAGRKRIERYWLERLAKRVPGKAIDPKSSIHYLVFTANAVTYEKIRQLNQEYSRSLTAILNHNDNRSGVADLDRVVLSLNHMLDLSAATKTEGEGFA